MKMKLSDKWRVTSDKRADSCWSLVTRHSSLFIAAAVWFAIFATALFAGAILVAINFLFPLDLEKL